MPTNMLLRHILPNNSCTSGKQMEMETIWGWGLGGMEVLWDGGYYGRGDGNKICGDGLGLGVIICNNYCTAADVLSGVN